MNYKYCPFCAYIGIYSDCPYCGTNTDNTTIEYNQEQWFKNRDRITKEILTRYSIKTNPLFNPHLYQLRVAEENLRQKTINSLFCE